MLKLSGTESVDDAAYKASVQDFADSEVDRLVSIGEAILAKVPGRVIRKLRKFQRNWADMGQLLSAAAAPNNDDSFDEYEEHEGL